MIITAGSNRRDLVSGMKFDLAFVRITTEVASTGIQTFVAVELDLNVSVSYYHVVAN